MSALSAQALGLMPVGCDVPSRLTLAPASALPPVDPAT
jgi:hypothetical protein